MRSKWVKKGKHECQNRNDYCTYPNLAPNLSQKLDEEKT